MASIQYPSYGISIFQNGSNERFKKFTDLQLICKNECLIKPVIRFPLFIQSLICFLNFSSVSKVIPRFLTVSLLTISFCIPFTYIWYVVIPIM